MDDFCLLLVVGSFRGLMDNGPAGEGTSPLTGSALAPKVSRPQSVAPRRAPFRFAFAFRGI